MPRVHEFVGFFVVAVFAVGWIWGLAAKLSHRGPGEGYWTWVAVAQITAGVQALLGVVLLIAGYRVDAAGTLGGVLHYVYGLLPIVLFVIAHVVARAGDMSFIGVEGRDGEHVRIRSWTPFAWAAFIGFGLASRALMTGLGLG
jgi:hypothetical protein